MKERMQFFLNQPKRIYDWMLKTTRRVGCALETALERAGNWMLETGPGYLIVIVLGLGLVITGIEAGRRLEREKTAAEIAEIKRNEAVIEAFHERVREIEDKVERMESLRKRMTSPKGIEKEGRG